MNRIERDQLLRLISRQIEQRISESEAIQLQDALRKSEVARRLYVQMMHQEAELLQNAARFSTPDASLSPTLRVDWKHRWFAIALAACVALIASAVSVHLWNTVPDSDQPAVAALRRAHDSQVKLLHSGHHRLQSGTYTIDFFSGAQLQMQGPASFHIHDEMHIEVERGSMVANVTKDARGFRITSPGASFVDLGTEFALSIAPDDAQLKVFRGQVLANTTNPKGSTERSLLVEPGPVLRYDGNQGRYHSLPGDHRDFDTFHFHSTAPLNKMEAYQKSIFHSSPTFYWDFQESEPGSFPDQIQGRLLRASGSQIQRSAHSDNQAVRFLPDEAFHMLELQGLLPFESNQPFSIEFLFCSDQLRRSSLLAMFVPDSVTSTGSSDHFILIEIMSRQDVFSHAPGVLRSTYRPKPSANAMDGINAFSRTQILPGSWNHVALTFDGTALRSYLNGELESHIHLHSEEISQAGQYAMVLGQTSRFEVPHIPSGTYRPFIGSIDELAIYDRALSASEIQERLALIPK
ncbi:MAG: LamG-like jellyroll fold domain-containing protein [Puniceicoccaceae bacterium]